MNKHVYGVMVQKAVPFSVDDLVMVTKVQYSAKLRDIIAKSGLESLERLLAVDGQQALEERAPPLLEREVGSVPALCVDLDNVIARTDEVMRGVIRDFTGGAVDLQEHHIKEFNYSECFDDKGRHLEESDWPKVHELFSEPRYLWLIQPHVGVVASLKKLRTSYEIHLATSRLPKARATTIAWLENHEIPIDDVHFLRRGKKHTSVGSVVAAVEDDYEQAVSFASEKKTFCYLMERPWNVGKTPMDRIGWVRTWDSLCEEVLHLGDSTVEKLTTR